MHFKSIYTFCKELKLILVCAMCFCFCSFFCAAVVKLDKECKRFEFDGPPCLWNGKTIKKRITDNSALYILEDKVHV